jgi:hypothetical protein
MRGSESLGIGSEEGRKDRNAWAMVKIRGDAGQLGHVVEDHGFVSGCGLDGACSMVVPHFAQMRLSLGSDLDWSLSERSCQDRRVAGTSWLLRLWLRYLQPMKRTCCP